jgi:soluble lytic murein transglycosylase
MKDIYPSTRVPARIFATAALVALASAIHGSAPTVRYPSPHSALYPIVRSQAYSTRTNVDERTVPDETQNLPRPHFLDAAEQGRVKAAFEAAARHDWGTMRRLAASVAVPSARKLIQWRYLVGPGSGSRFAELNEFLAANPGWPRRAALLVRAETSMPGNVDANYVVGWFGKRQPISAYGQIRLGEAEIAIGRSAIGEDRIRRAWVENAFDAATEKRIVARHSNLLTAQLQQQRLARLLIKENIAAVRRQLPRVQVPAQLALNARVLLGPSSKLGSIPSSVRGALGDDPWLLMRAAERLEAEHRPEDARRYLWRAALSDSSLIARDRLWPKLKEAARDAIAEQNYGFAYQLASHNGLQSGADYVEAEFMAGWLALEHLNQPQMALKHFAALRREATLPATISRSEYWLGRACDALRDKRSAMIHYRLAAQKGQTFYGQLAIVRLGHMPTLQLKAVNVQPSVAKLSLKNDERAQAARILSDIGERDLAREFALSIVEEDPSVNRFAAAIGLAEDLHDPTLSLRIAKEAERNNLLLSQYLHPVVQIPAQTVGHSPDPAVVLSIIRQESEFDPAAASNAGARGFMQLLPGTAKEAADRQHLRFDAARLGQDANYNIQLGASTFAAYLRFWSNSTLLAVASYNAGPGNVKKWLATFGDPRGGHVDPIDWIESIPFDETRTYVQRVLASTQVYRNRLRSKEVPLAIAADLRDSSIHVGSSAQVELASK